MALPVTFANLTNPNLTQLDLNFNFLAALVPVPCAVAGVNALTMTPTAVSPAVASYVNYTQFVGIVGVSANTTAVTIQVGSLAALNAYKDTPTGPVALAGGELQPGTAFAAIYDLALNAGAGGFHIQTGMAILVGQSITMQALKLNSGTLLKRLVSVSATVTFTVVPANTTQDQNIIAAGVAIGDSIDIGPPSVVLAGVSYSAFVPASGTVTLRSANVTAASLTPTGGLYRVTAQGFT